jgi:hypothetical protein
VRRLYHPLDKVRTLTFKTFRHLATGNRVGCVSFVSHCKTILAIFSILIHTVSSFMTDFQFSGSGITFSAYWLIKAWFVQWCGKAGVEWYEASQCLLCHVCTLLVLCTQQRTFLIVVLSRVCHTEHLHSLSSSFKALRFVIQLLKMNERFCDLLSVRY